MSIAELPATPPDWSADRDDELVCRQVRDETHDVRTFVFAAAEPRLFRYQPGQFLTLDLDIDGAAVNRCYTIASSPTRPHLISITVKRQPGGVVSPWLHANVRPGTRLRASLPMGEFTTAGNPARKFLFLSGGSGVTPLMAMARHEDDLAGDADIVFLHSARSPADIIFRTELRLMAEHRPGFRFLPIVEVDSAAEPWPGLRGRLNAAMLRLAAPDLIEREVFTCGPAPYMAAVRALLAEAGFDMGRYHEESFDFATVAAEGTAPPPLPDVAPAQAGFKVTFSRSNRVIDVAPDGFILAAAQAAGMKLPFSCAKGVCGTCKSRLVSGAVDMQHGGGIRKREIDAGQILICCSKPLGDLVIER